MGNVRNYQVYICGPIAGYPNLNKDAFAHAKQYIDDLGLYPVNPHDIAPFAHVSTDCPGGDKYYGHKEEGLHSSTCYMRTDIQRMLQCDAIYVLDGWEASIGGRLELMVAAQCGMDIFFERQKYIESVRNG